MMYKIKEDIFDKFEPDTFKIVITKFILLIAPIFVSN